MARLSISCNPTNNHFHGDGKGARNPWLQEIPHPMSQIVWDSWMEINPDTAKKMGINDLTKKYELNEIVTGDSIFCATGITTGDLVAGIKIQGNDFASESLVTHKSSGLKRLIKLKQNL